MTKKKAPEDRKKMGRPTDYTQELADRICDLVATHDMGLPRLTKQYPDLPDRVTINRWRRIYPDFRIKYAQAKCEQLEFMTEDIMDIADDGTNDWIEVFDRDGTSLGWKVNGEHIQRSRVRIDTRKWLAAKLAPKMYGDVIKNENNGDTHDDVMKRKQEMDEKNKKDY